MTTGNDWREAVGRTWADNYRLTDRSFAGLTERLLARIGGCEGKAVLDPLEGFLDTPAGVVERTEVLGREGLSEAGG